MEVCSFMCGQGYLESVCLSIHIPVCDATLHFNIVPTSQKHRLFELHLLFSGANAVALLL